MFQKKSSDKLPTSGTTKADSSAPAPTPPQQHSDKVQTPPAQPKAPQVTTGAATAQPQAKNIVVNVSSGGGSAVQPTTSPPAKQPAAAPAAAPANTTTAAKVVDKAARKAKGAKGFFKRAPTVVGIRATAAEAWRLQEDEKREKNWKRWGPYLSERQWATVREDYSADGSW